MSIGCNIYFRPLDSAWVAGPEFIRGLATWLEVDTFDFLRVYREAPSSSELHPSSDTRSELLQEVRSVPVEMAVSLQQVGAEHTTVMNFSGAVEKRFQDASLVLPDALSKSFLPNEGSFYNGPWKHYDYSSGKLASVSGCCLILGNGANYPVDLRAYLEAFMQAPSVVMLGQALEQLSGQTWQAMIDLT